MTLSPTETSSGTRLPLSSMRPGPIATTSPSWGFSLAVSGMTRPEAVVCSASIALTTIRSSSGLMLTDTMSTSTFWFSWRGAIAPVCGSVETFSWRLGGTPSRGSYVGTSAGTYTRRVPELKLALTRSECQRGSTVGRCQDEPVDLDDFRWLLGTDGQE